LCFYIFWISQDDNFERHESNWDYLRNGRRHAGGWEEYVEECLWSKYTT
jgi:hypothetical protein